MYSKEETLKLLSYLIKAAKENTLATPEHERTNYYRICIKIIKDSGSAEIAYQRFAASENYVDNEHYVPYENIWYREDCFEYLLDQGFNKKTADKLTHIIWCGDYYCESYQFNTDNLPEEFVNWALITKHLASRNSIFDAFYREYEQLKYTNKWPLPDTKRRKNEIDIFLENKLNGNPETFYTHDILKENTLVTDDENTELITTDYIAKKLLESDIFEYIETLETSFDKFSLLTTDVDDYLYNKSAKERVAAELCKLYPYNMYYSFCMEDYNVRISFYPEYTQKIDLVATDHECKEVYLMNLKTFNDRESLLSCITEIYTYFKLIDKVTLTKELGQEHEFRLTGFYRVLPAILVFEGSEQHLQLRSRHYKNVQKLMKKLGVRFFVLRSNLHFSDYEINRLRISEIPVSIIK